MGAAMDSKLLKAGAEAHHAAIGGLSPTGLCAEGKLTAILAGIGRMIASVPEMVIQIPPALSFPNSESFSGPCGKSRVKEKGRGKPSNRKGAQRLP